jgi:SAM-dependent methyltransferases related to tRNA (uracil-5-)-methyltransferase
MTEKKLKQDDIINIDIIAMGNDGSGIAHWEDYTLFIPFSIIGDSLQIKITYVKGNIAYAKILSVIKASEYRTEPQCKVYGKCGGCSLQHVVYDEQLKLKKIFLKQQ